ncbi:unnamed protein product [Musa acuminata subsp. burmannicoides]
MERSSAKMVLVLALFLASFAVGLEARNLDAEPKAYQPQNIPGAFRGFLGRPNLGGAPRFGLGRPFRGIPGFGTVPGSCMYSHYPSVDGQIRKLTSLASQCTQRQAIMNDNLWSESQHESEKRNKTRGTSKMIARVVVTSPPLSDVMDSIHSLHI